MIFIIKTYVFILCKIKGLQIVSASSDAEFEAADSFRQNVYLNFLGLQKLPKNKLIAKPQNIVGCWLLKKKEEIIGTVSLFDISTTQSFTEAFFSDTQLEFDRDQSLELTRIAVDQKFQRNNNQYFLILLFQCYKKTIALNKNYWLACGHRNIYQLAKKVGGDVQRIGRNAKILEDDSLQSFYWSNYQDQELIRQYRVFHIKVDRLSLTKIFKKFIRRKHLK